MTPLTSDQVRDALAKLDGWNQAGQQIARTFEFKNYYETMAFVNATAWISHREDHHPDLEVGYNRCMVRYSTHSAGGITAKDIECAGKIDRLLQL